MKKQVRDKEDKPSGSKIHLKGTPEKIIKEKEKNYLKYFNL